MIISTEYFILFLNIVIFNKKEKRMNYLGFKNRLQEFTVFSIHDIRKCFPDFDSRRLVEWQDKGYIKKIINRWYCFSDNVVNEEFSFLIANSIYSPSYISFESALSYYQLIPESVFTITSATSIKTNEFKTGLGNYNYRHIKPSLFLGYKLIESGNHRVKIAEPGKAILDYLYINEHLNTAQAFEGMRFNTQLLLPILNKRNTSAWLKLFANKALEKRFSEFLNYLKHA
jgi:predicted transcriptional regulator of viral defense system